MQVVINWIVPGSYLPRVIHGYSNLHNNGRVGSGVEPVVISIPTPVKEIVPPAIVDQTK